MGSAEGKQIYLERAATAETVNADLKTWRGPEPPAAARHHQGSDGGDLVGAHLQPDAIDENGLAIKPARAACFPLTLS